MAISSKQIIGLAKAGLANRGTRGRLMALERQVPPGRERALVRALSAALQTVDNSAARYVSPFDRLASVRNQARAPFSAADVAWITRLPADPAQILVDDVLELRVLEAQAEPRTGDERLVRSIIGPVRQHHAKLTAAAEITALKASAPSEAPSELRELLSLAIGAETPELTAGEALTRAWATLDDVYAEQRDRHAAAIADAEKRLTDSTGAAGGGVSNEGAAA